MFSKVVRKDMTLVGKAISNTSGKTSASYYPKYHQFFGSTAGVFILELPQTVRLIGCASQQEVTITRIILQLERESSEVT